MKLIPLTRGKVAVVDSKYYEALLERGSWCFDGVYATHGRRINGRHRCERMHVAVAILAGIDTSTGIDHRNGNKLDNRRRNLRSATSKQNAQNRGAQKNNKSGYAGVSFHKGRWRAVIQVNGHHKHLGYFDSSIEAARARDRAAKKHFGRFAKLTFTGKAA